MRLVFVQLSTFTAKWKRLGLTDDDLRLLEEYLLANPECGQVIPGTGGLRKLRFAPQTWHAGKRGATRVVYVFIAVGDAVYLFTIYGKNEQADLLPEKRRLSGRCWNACVRGIEHEKEQRHGSADDGEKGPGGGGQAGPGGGGDHDGDAGTGAHDG